MELNLFDKLPTKYDGPAFKILLILSIIAIGSFSIFLYKHSISLYTRLDKTQTESTNLNSHYIDNVYTYLY